MQGLSLSGTFHGRHYFVITELDQKWGWGPTSVINITLSSAQEKVLHQLLIHADFLGNPHHISRPISVPDCVFKAIHAGSRSLIRN